MNATFSNESYSHFYHLVTVVGKVSYGVGAKGRD